MSSETTSPRNGRSIRWSRFISLALVPLTVAGVLLWGLWNPQDRLESITAAVVNHDEPVELDGQTVPLGRLLAGELIGDPATRAEAESSNFTWVLTDEEDAEAGIADGRYATVVTIPENFSAAATSLSGEPSEVQTAHIDIAESGKGRLLDAALSNIVTQTATQMLNDMLGKQFVGNVYVGFNELRGGVVDAAVGAGDLADGGRQLAEGAGQLADGTSKLGVGANQLADGAGQLASGASQTNTGAQQLADGADQLSAGTAQAGTGVKQLADGLSIYAHGDGKTTKGVNDLAAGAKQLADGLSVYAYGDANNEGVDDLAVGIKEYTGGINSVLGTVKSTATQSIEPLKQARDAIAADLIPLPPEADKQEVLAQLDTLIAGLESTEALAPIDALMAQGDALAAGAQDAADGASRLAESAKLLADGTSKASKSASTLAGHASTLAASMPALTAGASQTATGASKLAAGTSKLAAGASGTATGASELAAGVPQLSDGASKLADGTAESAEGASKLSAGLGTAARDIPSTTKAERDKLAEAAVAPVEARGGSDELFNASGVPLFAGIALWAGALAISLRVAPLWRRARDAAQSVGTITMRSTRPIALLGLAQGAIVGIALPLMLGYDAAKGLRFFGFAVLASIAFALLAQGLSAFLGRLGRFAAFALLVIAFAAAVVSTAPSALIAIGDGSPIGTAFAGFQTVATGDGSAGGMAMLLVLWAVAGIVLTALAVRRARRS